MGIGAMINGRRAGLAVLFAVLATPTVAFAEVMDKEPSLLQVWVVAGIGEVVVAVLGWFRRWPAFVTAPLTALYIVADIGELHDRAVGPAILAEAGWTYFMNCYAAFAVLIAVHLVPIVLWKRDGALRRQA